MAPMPGIHITVKVDDFTASILTGAGWTPPGAVHEPPAGVDYIPVAEHQRILAGHAADHRRAMVKLQRQHREQLEQMTKERSTALRAERIKTRGEIRAEVAEEIAVDLEKPREWRMSPEKPSPWADIARAHAGGNPAGLPFPPNLITWSGLCTVCSHPTAQHSQLAGGCQGVSTNSVSGRCGCALDYGNR